MLKCISIHPGSIVQDTCIEKNRLLADKANLLPPPPADLHGTMGPMGQTLWLEQIERVD